MLKKLYHRKYHGWYRYAKQLFVFDIALLATIVALVGVGAFLYFYGIPVTSKVGLVISPPTNFSDFHNGTEFPLTIHWQNRSDVILQDVTLALILPDGYVTDDPTSLPLPDLVPGAEGHTIVDGTLYASVTDSTKFLATISYKQESRSVRENKTTLHQQDAFDGKTAYDMTIEPFNPVLFIGKTTPITISTCKTAITTRTLNGKPRLVPQLNNVITFSSSTSFYNEDTGCDDHIYDFTPTIDYSTGHNISFDWDIDFAGKGSVTIGQLPAEIEIVNAEPTTTIAAGHKTLELGTSQPYTLDITNHANWPIDDVRIIMDLETQPIWTILGVGSGIYDKFSYPELTRIESGETITIDFNRRTKSNPTITSAPITLGGDIMFTYKDEHQLFYDLTPLELTLPAQPQISAQARYFSPYGDQLGRGPLPPEVGEQTKYWVFINAGTKHSTTKNATLTVEAAPFVTFTGKQSVTTGQVEQTDNRKRIWNLNDIALGESPGFFVEVGYTPSESHVDKHVNLIQSITLSGFDGDTEVSTTHLPISSSLVGDEFAQDYATEVRAAP